MTVEKHHLATLERLVAEREELFRSLTWLDFAKSIRNRHPRPAGETDCVYIDDNWFEVGDHIRWVDVEGGDIEVVSYSYPGWGDEQPKVCRTRILPRPGH